VIRFAATLLFSASLLSCKSTTECRPSTVYLDIQLNTAALAADSIWVTLDIPNRTSITERFNHPPGETQGSVEFAFSETSYPGQQPIGVTVQARTGSTVLAQKSQTFTAATGCAWLELNFDEITTGNDDALPTHDANPTTGDTIIPPAVGAELCFNGIDDDINGKTDCADSACGPTVATCLPLLPGGGAGITVPASEECPKGFRAPSDIVLGRTIAAPNTCEGCNCGPAPTACRSTLFLYTDPNICLNDTDNSGGNVPIQLSTTTKCFDTTSPKTFFGGRFTTPVIQDPGTCTPSGTPIPTAATFANAEKFCKAEMQGGGCGSSQQCVPTVSQVACTLVEQGECPADLKASLRYREINDARRCGSCSCGTASGGQCQQTVTVSSQGCGAVSPSTTVLSLNSAFRQCGTMVAGNTTLGVSVTDQSTAGKCPATATVQAGEATGSRPVQLCCTSP